MNCSVALTIGLLFLLPPPVLRAQESKLDFSSPYLILDTRKTSTMQKELNEAAAAGYRLLVGAPTSGTIMALILEKVANPPDTYEYLLLANTKISTMQKELDEAAARGFRLVPSTLTLKDRRFGGMETMLVMEKAPGSQNHYRYLVRAGRQTSILQKQLVQAMQEGYTVVGMVARGKRWVILEKAVVQ
jgi:hypothetical protein